MYPRYEEHFMGLVTCHWACYVRFGTFITWKVMSRVGRVFKMFPDITWFAICETFKVSLTKPPITVLTLYENRMNENQISKKINIETRVR